MSSGERSLRSRGDAEDEKKFRSKQEITVKHTVNVSVNN